MPDFKTHPTLGGDSLVVGRNGTKSIFLSAVKPEDSVGEDGDVAFPTTPLSAPLFADDYTGANNDPWSPPWQTSIVGGLGAGRIDKQGNKGRLLSNAFGEYLRADVPLDEAGVEITYEFSLDVINGRWLYTWARAGADWSGANPGRKVNGYQLYIAYDGSAALEKQVAGTTTALDSGGGAFTAGPFTAGVNYTVKMLATGPSIKARVWPSASAEPSAWGVEGVDASFASGRVGLSYHSNGAGRTILVDNYSVIATPGVATDHTHAGAKGFVFHGSNANLSRPTGFASIEWAGSVEPINMANQDTWVVLP